LQLLVGLLYELGDRDVFMLRSISESRRWANCAQRYSRVQVWLQTVVFICMWQCAI